MRFSPDKRALTGETLESLTAALAERGEKAFRAVQVLDWVYKKRARSWDDMTNLPKALRTWLDETFTLMPASLVLNRHSADVTDKLLLELGDKSLIETRDHPGPAGTASGSTTPGRRSASRPRWAAPWDASSARAA